MDIDIQWHIGATHRASNGVVVSVKWVCSDGQRSFFGNTDIAVLVMESTKPYVPQPIVDREHPLVITPDEDLITSVTALRYEDIANHPEFIPFEELSESQIIEWVKSIIGSNRVAEIETIVRNMPFPEEE